ncbi:molybdopterin converting factor subunit 1 [Bacillus timonensis]|uniref:Molybdopterin synthase sulfur carrier subunit n=1 Tax=Bacillus timonensis TaxID=1033734 RepID=A0A4S3PPU7_9BACI|nr:molybdopterin converting factor subunit 1 [Bacillus timonensis]THE11205.1 molybdopterin converting factor subunit 1 [Bacillus timonensis]
MITVLFFAHLQEMAGTERISVHADQITISSLKEKLANENGLKNLDQIMFAINEEYAIDEDIVKAGDTVALIPPVSGG